MRHFIVPCLLLMSFAKVFGQEAKLQNPFGLQPGIHNAQFSNDGKLLLLVGANRRAHIYDAKLGIELHEFDCGMAGVINAMFSPNGEVVLASCVDKTVRIYSVRTGSELHILKGHIGKINSAVFNGDGSLILTASDDGTARIYDVRDGKELHVLKGHTSMISSASFSPDGKYALTASFDGSARIYNVSNGAEIHMFNEDVNRSELSDFLGENNWVNSAVFSPDGKMVLTANDNHRIHLYDANTGEALKVVDGFTNSIRGKAFSENNQFVLVEESNGHSNMCDVKSGKVVHNFPGYSPSFSPDDKLVFTIMDDLSLHAFDVSSGVERLAIPGSNNSFNFYTVSPDGRWMVTFGWDYLVHIYDLTKGTESRILEGYSNVLRAAVFSPDSKLVFTASMDNTARLNDLESGKDLLVLKGYTAPIHSDILSKNAKYSLNWKSGHYIEVFEVSTGYKFQELTKNIGPVTSASFSPNEQLILTTREDQTVCSFEIVSGKEIMRFGEKSGGVISAGISPDGSLVWVLKDNQTAYLYRMSNGQLVHSLKLGANACEGVGFSRNSKRLIASDQYNSINILYDVESGREVLTLNSPDYSPNGNIALSISEALTVKLYDIETGAELRSLIPNSECKVNLPYEASMNGYTDYLTSAKFSPDGEKILTTSLFDRPHLYDVSTGSESWGCECHANEHGYMFFSPDGRWIISGKSPIRIYDAATGKLIQELSAPTSHRNFGYANQLDDYHNQLIDQMDFLCLAVVSPDGEYLITSTRYSNGVATIYHIRTGEIIQMLRGHRDAIYSAVFSKDGKTVFTESWDHQSILWNISDGRPLCTRVQLEDNDWITYDEYFRFDGTSAAFEKLHVVCGLEAIRLTDVKDSLWVPGLLQQYKLGQPISKNRLPVVKLSDLKLCR